MITESLINRQKKQKLFFPLLILFAVFCIGSFIRFLVLHQPRNSILSIAFLLFIPLILGVEKLMKVRFPTLFTALGLFIAAGCILGSCYDLYTYLPWFDTLLHGISGLVFSCFGFALMQCVIGKSETKRRFIACLIFGFVFSLAIAAVWELFEYASGSLLGYDMQEDAIIKGFNSYLLSGTHNEIVEVDGIIRTIICYGDGQQLVINGYLDIGLIDTMADIAICSFGAVVYLILLIICRKEETPVRRWLIPDKIM